MDPSKYAGTSDPGNQFGRALALVLTLVAPRRSSVAVGIAARVKARAWANIVVVVVVDDSIRSVEVWRAGRSMDGWIDESIVRMSERWCVFS